MFIYGNNYFLELDEFFFVVLFLAVDVLLAVEFFFELLVADVVLGV